MPHYDYQCTHCGYKEEILQKITENPLEKCPQCQEITFKRKVGRGSGLQFQGSGFYSTDYLPKSAPASKEAPTSNSSSEGCGCGQSSCNKPSKN